MQRTIVRIERKRIHEQCFRKIQIAGLFCQHDHRPMRRHRIGIEANSRLGYENGLLQFALPPQHAGQQHTAVRFVACQPHRDL